MSLPALFVITPTVSTPEALRAAAIRAVAIFPAPTCVGVLNPGNNTVYCVSGPGRPTENAPGTPGAGTVAAVVVEPRALASGDRLVPETDIAALGIYMAMRHIPNPTFTLPS